VLGKIASALSEQGASVEQMVQELVERLRQLVGDSMGELHRRHRAQTMLGEGTRWIVVNRPTRARVL
jgi:hypothetical protein